jgi:hypothetical protein
MQLYLQLLPYIKIKIENKILEVVTRFGRNWPSSGNVQLVQFLILHFLFLCKGVIVSKVAFNMKVNEHK